MKVREAAAGPTRLTSPHERGLAQPTESIQLSENGLPHPWQFHGWAAMPLPSRDSADVKLTFLSLVY